MFFLSVISIISIHHWTANAACTPQLDMTLFQCTHARLTEVPLIVHQNTFELDLSYNLIEILHEDSFNRLHGLRKLILNHNKIYKLTERAFLPLAQSLTLLDLSSNQIMSTRLSHFPTTALAPLTQLTHLYLSHNPLGILPSGFLRYMGANLTHLEISSSTVEMQLQAGAFRGLARLHHLSLAHNTFTEIHEDSFDGLRPEQFSRFSLQGVQWHCDCRILWLRRWLNRVPQKAFFPDRLPGGECIAPTAFKGHSLLSLNMTDLQCAPRLLGTIPPGNEVDPLEPIHVVGLQGYELGLSCTFISEPKMQVEWFQNGVLVQPHWTRIKQITTTGTKFTTSLQIHRLNVEMDEGLYQCQTTNQIGTATASFMVQIDSNGYGGQISLNTPREQAGTTSLKSDESTRYLIIIGIIVAANMGFVIVGATTYNCVRYKNCLISKRRVQSNRQKPSVIKAADYNTIENNHNAGFSTCCTEQRDPASAAVVSYASVLPNPQIPYQLLANGSANVFVNQSAFPHSTIQAVIPNQTLSPQLSRVAQPLFGTPSPLSSDMGYSASFSSQTHEHSANCDQQVMGLHGVQVDTRYKPYYTLTSKRPNLPSLELSYQPNVDDTKIQIPRIHQAELNSFDVMRRSGTNEEFQLPESTISDDLDPDCPIHGRPRDHPPTVQHLKGRRCTLHESEDESDVCPVHGISGTRVNIGIHEWPVKEADRTQLKLGGKHGLDCQAEWRYSNPNLQDGQLTINRVGCEAQHWRYGSRISTLPR